MQICKGDNFYKMSNPGFWEKLENYHHFVIHELAQRVVKVIMRFEKKKKIGVFSIYNGR